MQQVLLGGTCAWLLAVAWSDWTRLRLPNLLLLAATATWLVAAVAGMHPLGLGPVTAAAAGALVLCAGLPLLAAGWVAAGDVKLLAALGTLFGPSRALVLVWAIASLLAALHVGAWHLARRLPQARGLRLAPADPGAAERLRLPHGAHLAAAAAFMYATELLA